MMGRFKRSENNLEITTKVGFLLIKRHTYREGKRAVSKHFLEYCFVKKNISFL